VTPRYVTRLALFGALTAAVAQAATIMTQSYSGLIVVRSVIGVGCGLAYAAALAAAACSPAPDRAVGIAQVNMNLLFLMLFACVPWILETGGVTTLLSIFAGLFAVLSLSFLVLKKVNTIPDKSHSLSVTLRKHPGLASSHLLATALLNLGFGVTWGFAERAGIASRLTAASIGQTMSATMAAMILGSLAVALIADKLGRAVPMLIGASVCGIAAVFIMEPDGILTFALAVMLFGAGNLFVAPYVLAGVPSQLDPSGGFALLTGGTFFLTYSLGIALGGVVVDNFGFEANGWLGFATCITSGIIFFFVARHLHEK
jgi:predicted MFS family arabinose efflux permease